MDKQRKDDRLRVAVVEDDESILDAVQLVLEAQGWRASTYGTGEEFLADLADGKAFDCVLLDPHLPGKTGVDVAQAMSGRGMPFVVLTARPDSPLTHALEHLGACAIIVKPVDAAALTAAIEAAVPRPA